MPKKPDPRRIKKHWIYTLAEAAEALGLHRQTIIRWIKFDGLLADCTQRPWLIEGTNLKTFLEARRALGKCKTRPEQIYCLPCRTPQIPAGRMAEFQLKAGTSGQMIGICPDCDRFMHKAVSRSDLDRVRAVLEVTIRQAQPRIVGEPDLPASVAPKGVSEDAKSKVS